VTGDGRRILAAQALRAFGYGFGAVLLGVVLRARGWPSSRVGVLLALVVAGTVAASLLVGWVGDRLGRRRLYGLLYVGLAGAGIAFGLSDRLWVLGLVALTGTLSTEVVESGPFTSLEQAMLAQREPAARRTRAFGAYNAVATLAGAAGALAVGGPGLLHRLLPGVPGGGPAGPAGADQRWFLLLAPVGVAGALLARSLSARVEAGPGPAGSGAAPPATARGAAAGGRGGRLRGSRPTVLRLAGLFAVDALGGGFVVQSFIAYWLAARFGASVATLGLVFFLVGLLQTASFLVASRLAERIGLLPTMVFTHLPSNVLLAAIAFAPSLPVAVGLLFARQALSQMDVPTRQAYVMALVDPAERTAAAAWTNTARYLTRPAGPALAGVASQLALGAPFVVAGAVKAAYDLTLWAWFRHVALPGDTEPATRSAVSSGASSAISSGASRAARRSGA
jgi:MFS family permease